MIFDADKFVQDVSRALIEENSELPAYNSNYAFAVVNSLGILHLINKHKTIFRKQHLRVTMESTQLSLPLFNELLPSHAMFKIVLLIGDNALLDFSYCYKAAEMMNTTTQEDANNNSPAVRPVFVASPFCFWYGDFAENTRGKYSDTTINLGGRIRMNSDIANSFDISDGDEVHIRGSVNLRITGSRRFLHITKSKIEDGSVVYFSSDSDRKKEFNSWLRIQSYLHGHTLPEPDGEYPMIVNPLEDIKFE